MIDLNDKNAITAIDKKNAYSSLVNLPKQCTQAWDETQNIIFPRDYRNVQNIVLCGMGGSAYAALIIKSLYSNVLPLPFELVNGYGVPKYVGENSLVLLSSYSGSTEEVLACAKEAFSRKAKIAAVCNGSKLGEFVTSNSLPGYIFKAKHNPSGQPRLGQGYMIFGHVGLLANNGFLSITDQQVQEAIAFLSDKNSEVESIAKNTVEKLKEKISVIVAAEHLAANAHVMRNQLNETSKTFSAYSLIPELNHHLMEGLAYPKERILTFVLFRSILYSQVIQKRFGLTKEVVEKNGIETIDIQMQGSDTLSQMLYALSLGGYVTFYLGISYGQDPSDIPWVDYFKAQLAKTS